MRYRTEPTGRPLLAAQGAFYLATGLWPLLHRSSFERVTGPKADFWLARTVGSLLAVMGAAMIAGASRPRVTRAPRVLAMGAAGALGTVDIVYAGARRRISRVYLLDALAEAGLLAAWAAVAARAREYRRRAATPEILSGE